MLLTQEMVLRRKHTNEENQSVSGGFDSSVAFYAKESHARNDGADKVYVENGKKVDKMEDHGRGQEPKTSEGSHCGVVADAINERQDGEGL